MLDNVKLYFRNNSSTILTCVGIVGVVATAIMAVKATPKATKMLTDAQEEKGEKLTKTEMILTVAPAYIPTVITGAATITCIVSANILNKHQQAAITSAYALLDQSFKDYKGKVVELYGEDTDKEIRNEIVKDKYNESDMKYGSQQLFYDEFSKRFFESTSFKVQQAEYYLNRDLTMRDYAYLNEFYEYLDIDEIDSGWKLGWSTGSCLAAYWQPWIDFNHRKVTMEDGVECTIITMFQEPFADFEDYA